MARCAFVSFRFGHTDGVSVVARQWIDAFAGFGFEVLTVAGEGEVDRLIPGLAIDATAPPRAGEVRDTLADVDLVVVENLCTIPLNVPAALVTATALAGRPAVMHHHDPPWHRDRFEHVDVLPVHDPAWRHVTINHVTAAEMASRGFDTTVIYNGFERGPGGDRHGTRARLDVSPGETLVLHPVRAIERKNVPKALQLTEVLEGTYWLSGPAEEGYGPTLDRLLGAARCRVIRAPCETIGDAYAAADVVAFPSTWEGFGNPPVEAALWRKPAAVGHYPCASELRAMGFRWFEPDEPSALAEFLASPDDALLDHNESLASTRLSTAVMRAGLAALLEQAGWLP